MAYKVIWSPAARDDLHDRVVFIERDNPYRAMSFGYRLISETDRLQEFPELGRILPEYRNDNVREINLAQILPFLNSRVRNCVKIEETTVLC
jgi:toxin ParE1/3/4